MFRMYGKLPNKKDLLQNKLKVSTRRPHEPTPVYTGTWPAPPIPYRHTAHNTNPFPPSLQERKYFDSGDYALSKAGKAQDVGASQIGREHPVPENIPHSSTPTENSRHGSISAGVSGSQQSMFSPPLGAVTAGSPVKESSFLNRETSIDEVEAEGTVQEEQKS